MKMKKTLKALRLANELTEEIVAARLHVPTDYILALEDGRNELSLEELKNISNLYKIPVAKIISFIELEEDDASFEELLFAYLNYKINDSVVTCVRFRFSELDSYLKDYGIQKHKTIARYLIRYSSSQSEPFIFGDDPIKILKKLNVKQLQDIRNIGVKGAKQIYELLH